MESVRGEAKSTNGNPLFGAFSVARDGLDEPAPLTERDLFQVGGFKFLFRVEGVADDSQQTIAEQNDLPSRGDGRRPSRHARGGRLNC
jgi:hypothetical protein